jgi:capsular exopolysaccharide synthesis family protein
VGRIDDALRRAGQSAGRAVEEHGSAEADAVFSAPWVFATGGRVAPQISPPAPPIDRAVEHLSLVGEFDPSWAERLVVSPNADPAFAEQFRRLGASLHQAQVNDNLRLIMVTSALPEDGKTLSAINLSLILSESYQRRVLLIDADLRRPSIREISNSADLCGLSEALKAKSERKLSAIRISERLTLLPAGHPDPDPMSSLTSERMRRILEEAAARFDWVVLDAPPVTPLADASLLAGMVDAALLVVRAGQTPFALVQKAVEALGRERIFGVVLNGVTDGDRSEYLRYYGRRAQV